MFGWMIVFALMILPGAAATLAGRPSTSLKTSSIVFGALLLISVFTRVVRGRA